MFSPSITALSMIMHDVTCMLLFLQVISRIVRIGDRYGTCSKAEFSVVTRASSKAWIPELIAAAAGRGGKGARAAFYPVRHRHRCPREDSRCVRATGALRSRRRRGKAFTRTGRAGHKPDQCACVHGKG